MQAPSLSRSANIIEKVTAVAERNLQKKERLKLVREDAGDSDAANSTSGEEIIGELIQKGIILMPWAIDPHGKWGPVLENFLFNCEPRQHPLFEPTQSSPLRRNTPNAKLMYQLSMNPPSPVGVVTTACIKWKRARTRRFFGHSHTAPTPKEYLLGELGLGITKALAVHLRISHRKFQSNALDSSEVATSHSSVLAEALV